MKEVIILAGGFGTRLKSVLKDKPKCLAEICGKPFLNYLLDSLIYQGFSHFVFALGYKSGEIIDFVRENYPELSVTFSIEKEPLLTGGAIRLAIEKCNEDNILIINADTYFGINLIDFYIQHMEKKADVTIALKLMENFDRYGTLVFNDEKRIIRFVVKIFQKKGFINCGYIIIKKEILLDLPINKSFSFEKDFLSKILDTKKIIAYTSNSYFIDIGIPEDFRKAQIDFKDIQSINNQNFQNVKF